ncbi:hypothetical protein BH11MYX1_BH11MYX1_25010 [soil metagenome]
MAEASLGHLDLGGAFFNVGWSAKLEAEDAREQVREHRPMTRYC